MTKAFVVDLQGQWSQLTLSGDLTLRILPDMSLSVKNARPSFLSRLWAFSAMLCIALTLGMGATAVQANASILAHIACGDSELSDGGWVCNCEPGEGGCIKHIPDNGQGHGNDMLEMHHHHHGEVPSSAAAAPIAILSPSLWGDASVSLTPTPILHGIDPSQADQPPKI